MCQFFIEVHRLSALLLCFLEITMLGSIGRFLGVVHVYQLLLLFRPPSDIFFQKHDLFTELELFVFSAWLINIMVVYTWHRNFA
jgi:hypothetical protein